MTSSPWLTVVTVVKDDAAGFERTLASMSQQDLAGVEYLVVDSSGDRGAIPGLLGASGIPGSVTWTEPAGIYAAMNAGLAAAAGTYVYFLNAGDELAGDDVIARLRDAIDRDAPAWCYGDVEILGADGSRVVTPPWDYEAEKASAFSRGHFPAHQGTVVRTDVLRSVGGFDPSFSIVADYAAFLRLTQVSGPLRLDLVLARFHEGGVSTTRWAASLRQFRRARREILRPAGAMRRRELLGSIRQFAAMAAYRSPWPLTGALMLLAFVLMGCTGVAWGTSAVLTLFVSFQGLGGALWWRLLRPSRSVPVFEAIGMGLGLGTAAAMLTGLAGAWWLAPFVAVIAWPIIGRRRAVADVAPLARPDLWALAVGLVPGLAAFGLALRSYPLTWTGLWSGYHGDMAFFEALAASVAKLGPGASIFMSGYDIRYHSLAYGWAGHLTQAAGAEPFVVLTRLLPLVTLVGAIALAGSWARQLTRVTWAPALAVGLVVTGGFVGATYGSVLNFDSPSQSMGTIWLLALSPILLQALRRVSLPWHLMPVAVLMTALTGGKISTAAIVGGGLGLVVLVGLLRREAWRWRALGLGSVALLTLISVYAWLLAGSANAGGLALFTLLDRASSVQGLNPVVTPKGIVAGVLVLVIAVIPRWVGLAWLVGDRATRWAPETVYGVGLAGGAVATIIMLSGGFNDLWFAVAASAPLAVLSATGVAVSADWLGPAATRRVLVATTFGMSGALVVTWIWATGSTGIIGDGWRWSGPFAGVVLAAAIGVVLAWNSGRPRLRSAVALAIVTLVTMAVPARLLYALAEPFARAHEGSLSTVLFSQQREFTETKDRDASPGWTASQSTAGAWLRVHAAPNDLVATNVTLSAVVPALTHLATYVSDIHMQAPYGRVGDLPTIRDREAQSWSFVDDPSATTLAPLCAAGVDWVWVDPRRTETANWAPYANAVWTSKEAVVLRLEQSACG